MKMITVTLPQTGGTFRLEAKEGVDVVLPGPDEKGKRIAELELELLRLRRVMLAVAHAAATLGSGSEGWLRGRFMSLSNELNAALGRSQSVHGDQYDAEGSVIERERYTS